MPPETKTVAEVIRHKFGSLTRAERQLATTLLDNYPLAGLGSITTLADHAGVSTPTVARMVQKLGYKGYAEFQSMLHLELEATLSNPIAKHDRWATTVPGTHVLNRFAEATMANLRETLNGIDPRDFDSVAELLSNRKHAVYFIGGRITRALASYFYTHMQVIRPNAQLIPENTSAWTQCLLNMNRGDVLVVFDVRRYEQDLATLAEVAQSRGIVIVLFTDQWTSPVARNAAHVFRIRIEVPSAWDSAVGTMFVVEALIEAIQNAAWDDTRERISTLESLFEKTRLFRKPV